MKAYGHIHASVRILITAADIPAALQSMSEEGITLTELIYVDPLQVRACMDRRYLPQAEQILKRSGAKIRVESKHGLNWGLHGLLRRPLLILSMLIFLFTALYIPSRVLFFRVEGNTTIPTREILENAEKCGVVFGASRRKVRSEKMKNALIEEMPQLQWVGINTHGCVATISVREKSQQDAKAESNGHVTSIVASRDGIVHSVVVQEGNLLCSIGQAVKEGQLLVSGYTDCGLIIRATRAEGEIFAKTIRQLQFKTPTIYTVRGKMVKEVRKYSLRIGKKLINFRKDSGILDATCVKMYEENYWSLPGGFQLPFAVITERWIYYDAASTSSVEKSAFAWVEDWAQHYLLGQMIAGEILQADTSLRLQERICILDAQYTCLEMIGKNKAEETLLYDGKNM